MNLLNLSTKDLCVWLILKEKIKDLREDLKQNMEGMVLFRKINSNPGPEFEAKIRKGEEATHKVLNRIQSELGALQAEFKTIDIEITKGLGT